MDLSLARMQEALKELQHPAAAIPAVQVVGTNGKGSIACFIHHGLITADCTQVCMFDNLAFDGPHLEETSLAVYKVELLRLFQ